MIEFKVILQPKDIFMGGISNIFVLEYSTYMKNNKIVHFTCPCKCTYSCAYPLLEPWWNIVVV